MIVPVLWNLLTRKLIMTLELTHNNTPYTGVQVLTVSDFCQFLASFTLQL